MCESFYNFYAVMPINLLPYENTFMNHIVEKFKIKHPLFKWTSFVRN